MKNRNLNFLIGCCFTWKVELVWNIWLMIVGCFETAKQKKNFHDIYRPETWYFITLIASGAYFVELFRNSCWNSLVLCVFLTQHVAKKTCFLQSNIFGGLIGFCFKCFSSFLLCVLPLKKVCVWASQINLQYFTGDLEDII